MTLVESDPQVELTVDLDARKVRLPDGSDIDDSTSAKGTAMP